MRPLLAVVRALGVFVLFAALVFAGSTSLRDGAGTPGRGHDASTGPGLALSPEAGVVRGASKPLPPEGTRLLASNPCEATSVRPDAAGLQAGMRAIGSDDWRSSDGGVSAPLADGRTIWMFGDTVKVSGRRAVGMVGNSMLVSSGTCFAQMQPAGHGPVVPDDTSGATTVTLWPTSAVSVARGGWTEVFVLCNRLTRQRGFWNFTLLGTSLARFAVPDGQNPRLLDVRQLSADDDDPGHVTWGTAAVQADGWVYVYGTQVVSGSLGRAMYVARARVEDLADIARWQFHGATGWGANAPTAVLGAQPGVSHVVSVFPHAGAWYLVSKVGGDLGDDVGLWKASSPSGPFDLVKRERHPYSVGGKRIRYMPLAHPEVSRPGSVVVSMSRNVTGGSDIASDYALGRPEFFTMELP